MDWKNQNWEQNFALARTQYFGQESNLEWQDLQRGEDEHVMSDSWIVNYLPLAPDEILQNLASWARVTASLA